MQGNVKKQAGAELCQAKESYAKNAIHLGTTSEKKTVKRVTSYIFQITPSLLTLRMTSERMTNHNNQI